jgi:hypothetical protein
MNATMPGNAIRQCENAGRGVGEALDSFNV